MSNSTVSVIVVSHNNWPAVDLAVASALAQTRPPDEVILVDNASADGSPDRIESRYGRRVRVIRQANRLDSGGYNAGIQASTGDLIQLLDGDDLLTATKLEYQVAALAANDAADIAYGNVRRFLDSPGDARWADEPTRQYDDVLWELCANAGTVGGLAIHSVLLRRRAVERVGRFDETIWGADYDYWFRAAAAGCRFLHVPESLVLYRQWAGQMSSDMASMVTRHERTIEKALTYISEEPYRSALEEHLNRIRFRVTLHGNTPTERAKALDMLKATRRASPAQVSLLRYAMAAAAVRAPDALRDRVRRLRVSRFVDRLLPR